MIQQCKTFTLSTLIYSGSPNPRKHHQKWCFFFFSGLATRMSRTHSHTQIKHHIAMNCLFCKSSLVRIGFETLLRRFRVGSLVGRSKFLYKIPRASSLSGFFSYSDADSYQAGHTPRCQIAKIATISPYKLLFDSSLKCHNFLYHM